MDRRRAELASGTSNGLAVSAEAVAPFGTRRDHSRACSFSG